MYSPQDLQDYPVWRHVKQGGLYNIMGLALCATNGPDEHKEWAVVYFSMDHQGMRYRRLAEFLDGRFVPVPPPDQAG
jgi:hypothetical protein